MKKLAIILSRFPYPLEKGDKLRAYHQIVYLSSYFNIGLFVLETTPTNDEQLAALQPYCSSIIRYPLKRSDVLQGIVKSLIYKQPVQVGYFFSERVYQQMQHDLNSFSADTIYAQLSRTALYVKDRKEYKVCDFQDAFSLNYQRLAKSSWLLRKWFYRRESTCMNTFEQRMMQWFNDWTIISEMDRLAISPRITIVSNGVDRAKFKIMDVPKPYDVLFLGNLTYAPNLQAANFLIQHILPELIAIYPSIKVAIAGANMPDTIRSKQSSNLICLGWVDDIVSLYNSARLFVAPLFSGAGLQNKVLEAMSCGVPVVCSTVVNASLQAQSGEVVIANDGVSFAKQIKTLLQDPFAMKLLSEKASHFILEHYQWHTENEKLKQLLLA